MKQSSKTKQNTQTEHHILIIEDDVTLAGGLCRALQNERTETLYCTTLREARRLLEEQQTVGKQYSLVLLDVNLPDGSGFDFLQEIKKEYDICVIMLTANDMETDIVAGLELGADDYITKPFSLAVLRARVETQLRRVQADRTSRNAEQIVVIDDYCFNFTQMLFMCREERIELSKTEQKLLYLLVENQGITLTREQLLDRIWSETEFVDENALSVTVKRLRDKLGAQERIKTVYGIGYRWE
ncbi:MAG: response regulator transcription factor [Lachnospiraceae bacterium]|nr:response regulator transcription factor [Lachnospiraceae bacterium]